MQEGLCMTRCGAVVVQGKMQVCEIYTESIFNMEYLDTLISDFFDIFQHGTSHISPP